MRCHREDEVDMCLCSARFTRRECPYISLLITSISWKTLHMVRTHCMEPIKSSLTKRRMRLGNLLMKRLPFQNNFLFFLFNDALNTFYLRLYGVRHMVNDHSYSETGNPLLPHRLLLSINSKGSFYMHHPTDRITHTTAFVTPVVEHWLKGEIAQWVHPMKDRSDDPPHHERTLYL